MVAAALVVGLAPMAHADDAIDGLPDPSARILRWPLSPSEHPELAPRYPVAKDLAEPGLDWIQLCTMGAHKRTTPNQRDQTAYLGALCAIANHDVDAGIAGLRSLLASKIRGLPAAIRVDIANVLANEGSAERARFLLSKHRIDDLAVHDRLVALFIDMNKLADATEINDLAIGVGDDAPNACERQARRVVMNSDVYRGGFDRQRLVRGPSSRCNELGLELACWLDLGGCGAFFKSKGRGALVGLFDAYRAHSVGSQGWKTAMYNAIATLKSPDDLTIVLDVLVRTASDECPDPRRWLVRSLLWQISYREGLPPTIRTRVEDLLDELRPCAN